MTERKTSNGDKIRVLHLIRDLDTAGGPYDLLRQLRSADLTRLDHTVAHFLRPDTLSPEFQTAGIDVIDLSSTRQPFALLPLILTRLIRTRGIDIVHTNTRVDRLHGQLAAWLTRKPVVNTLRGFSSARFYGWGKKHRGARIRIEHSLDRRTVRHVIAVSDAIARRWVEHDDLCASGRRSISVIYSGVQTEAFAKRDDPALARLELGLPSTAPIILSVGHLRPVKGHRLLVPMMRHVLNRLPETRLLIAGEGPERDGLEISIRDQGLDGSITLLGRRDDIPLLLEAADVFVFPSYNDQSGVGEAFGMAAIEAMAAAKPVVAFDVPPFDEYLIDGATGHLVSPGDPLALAEAVLSLLGKPQLAFQQGRAARQVVRQRFDIETQATALRSIYEQVVNAGQA